MEDGTGYDREACGRGCMFWCLDLRFLNRSSSRPIGSDLVPTMDPGARHESKAMDFARRHEISSLGDVNAARFF
jgi:hypothetical protein